MGLRPMGLSGLPYLLSADDTLFRLVRDCPKTAGSARPPLTSPA